MGRLFATVLLLCVIEMASFGMLNMILLTRSEIDSSPGPTNQTIQFDKIHISGHLWETTILCLVICSFVEM